LAYTTFGRLRAVFFYIVENMHKHCCMCLKPVSWLVSGD